MSTRRAIPVVLAALGLGLVGLTGQAGAQTAQPSLINVSSSAVEQTSAILNATIDPGGSATAYRFEYGTTAAYGMSIPVPAAEIGSAGQVVVEQDLTGLDPGTLYHYRVVAANSVGQVFGSDQTLETAPLQPPVVSTGQARGIAQNAATLTGTIDTQGFETVYEFDFGVDTSYGTRLFGDAGVEPGAETYTFALQGLTAGATYHYRIVATNAFGTTYGADQAFTTATYPSASLAAPPTPPLLSTHLLASASSASGAKAARVESAAHAARAGKRRNGTKSNAGKRKQGREAPSGHSHGVDRGRGK